MTLTREDKVKQFRDAADKGTYSTNPEDTPMIVECIREELVEFIDAITPYYLTENVEARDNLCKEWADLQYVVSQAAVFFEIPADEAFDRVHNSNMTKVVEGKVIFRDDGKILKPDTYVAPDMCGL